MDVLYCVFSNSGTAPLDTLAKEYDYVKSALEPRSRDGDYYPDLDPFFKRERLTPKITEHKDNLFLFHYSGHADRDYLEPNDEILDGEGVIHLLGRCKNLKLVFLNGCSTWGQVEGLLEAGIPVVIATSAPVRDDIATKFSKAFYEALKHGHNIGESFELAVGEVKSLRKGIEIHRGIKLENVDQEEPVWGVFYKEENAEVLHFTLPVRGQSHGFAVSPYYWENEEISRDYFYSWIGWSRLFPNFERFPFQTSEEIQAKITQLHNWLRDGITSIRILGLPGLGKTRVIYEAFRLECINDLGADLHYGLLYYDVGHENVSLLLEYVKKLSRTRKKGLIVIDNCPQNLHERLKTNLHGTQIRLITIGSLHEDIEAYQRGELSTNEVIFFSPKESKKVISKILKSIDPSLSNDILPRLNEFAGGFPLLAVLLAEENLNNHPQVGKLNDRELAQRLLGISTSDDEIFKVLQTISIFERVGFYEELFEDVKKISTCEALLSPGLPIGERTIDLFYQVCNKYQEIGILEKTGRYLSLKPKPLALRLASECWKDKRPERVKQIFDYFSEDPLGIALCEQMKYLDFLPEAQRLTEELCGPSAPFGQAEVLNSNYGSRLFRSLIEVNPKATLETLWRVFGDWNIEQLKSVGPGRRNLIWGLEKLCFPKDLFDRAAKLIMKFAAAENESISNNATGQFLHLFQIYIPGTEADLYQRLSIIEYGMGHDQKRFRELAFAAMAKGLQTESLRRFGGAEILGSRTLEDYRPSVKEIHDYWNNILDRLIELACSKNQFSKEAVDIIGRKIRGLCYAGEADLILNAVKKVYQCSNKEFWEEALRELKVTLKYEKNRLDDEQRKLISDLITEFSPTDIPNKYKLIVVDASWADLETGADISQQELTEKRIDQFIEEIYPDWEKHIDLFFLPTQFGGEYFGRLLAKKLITERGIEGVKEFQTLSIDFLNQQEDLNKIGFTVLYGFHKELNNNDISDRFIELLSGNEYTRPFVFDFADRIPVSKDAIWKLFDLVDKDEVSVAGFIAFRFTHQFDSDIDELFRFCEKIATYGTTGGWIALIILHSYYFNKIDRIYHCKEVLRKILLINGLWLSKEKRRYSSSDEVAWQTPAIKLLEDSDDHELAMHISKEIGMLIEKESVSILPFEQFFKPVLEVLIKKYFDIIWPIIGDGLLSNQFLDWRSLVGSDRNFHGYSPGKLFEYGDHNKIFDWCTNHVPKGPLAIAWMMPKVKSNEEQTELHPFTKKMIDEFGNIEGFMMRFDDNISTYGAVGSVVPLFEKKKKMIEELIDHPVPEVQAWARHYVRRLEDQIRLERNWEEEKR